MRNRMVVLLLLLCGAIPALWGLAIAYASPMDFGGIYYGARCLLQHEDPYKAGAGLNVYIADGGERPGPAIPTYQILSWQTYLPTTLVLALPISMLPWGTAHILWMIFSEGCLTTACFLIWEIASEYSGWVALLLACFLLANSEVLFSSGNAAGIVVSFCVVGVWCFFKERLVAAGVLCLAVSLVVKPHDTGLVWLYFLLAGGVDRKRALQSVMVAVLLSVPAFLWVWHVSPHWLQELSSNLQALSVRGRINDPGPASYTSPGAARVIDLQGTVSIFRDDPHIYNPISYLICGTLFLVWLVGLLRSHSSPTRAWLALAAVAPLTMLVTYHRPYDAKLLLLSVPACALLWAEGGVMGWLALVVNGAGIMSTSDIPLAILMMLTSHLHAATAKMPGKIVAVIATRPTQFILLAMVVFYLYAYVRRDPGAAATCKGAESRDPLTLPSTD